MGRYMKKAIIYSTCLSLGLVIGWVIKTRIDQCPASAALNHGYPIARQVRYGFTLQNNSARVIPLAKFWTYAIDDKGKPICCEMWPGNTTDVKTLIPVTDRIRKRFGINSFCIVADRGMVSADKIEELEGHHIPYILGTRMRRVNEIKFDVLSRSGRYSEVYPEGLTSKDPAPLRVKQVIHNYKRLAVRSECKGVCGKVFQSVGVALPPTIKEV
jgi:hypothetical protein